MSQVSSSHFTPCEAALTSFLQMHLNCVKGEVQKMLSNMRLNRRWASGLRFKREIPLESESPLIRSFKMLAAYLQVGSAPCLAPTALNTRHVHDSDECHCCTLRVLRRDLRTSRRSIQFSICLPSWR